MKMIVAILASTFFAQFSTAASDEPVTESKAQLTRQSMGIVTIATNQKYVQYKFREDGTFLVSREKFSTQKDAAAFCSSIQGYALTGSMLHSVLTMMGLPFVDLYKTALIKHPVLGRDGGRTGVVSWMQMDLSNIPNEEKLTESDRTILAFIKTDDYFHADLNGDSGSGSGPHQLSVVNSRLARLGQPSLAVQAVCEDKQLNSRMTR